MRCRIGPEHRSAARPVPSRDLLCTICPKRADGENVIACALLYYPGTVEHVSATAFEVLIGVVGLALVALGIYGILRNKFEAPATGGALGASINVPVSTLLVILGLGGLGYAGYLATTGSTKAPVAAPSESPDTPASSPTPTSSPTTPLSASPVSTGSPSRTESPITLSCSLSQGQLAPGMTVQLTYHVHSLTTRQVGLGAGLYDDQGNDHSNGDGDVDNTTLPQGQSSPSRPVVIPANLPAGKYEITAEIWPANEIGQDNVNDIIDTTCTHFSVP